MAEFGLEFEEPENDQVRITLNALEKIATNYPVPSRDIHIDPETARELLNAQSELLAIANNTNLSEVLTDIELANFNLGKQHLTQCLLVYENLVRARL